MSEKVPGKAENGEEKIDPEILEVTDGFRKDALKIQEARKAYKYPWWESRDMYIVALGQLSEPVLVMHPQEFANALSIVLRREFRSDEVYEYAGDAALKAEVEATQAEWFKKK
ncbi:MAG: hypothetical protein JWN90_218 [Parcubacteria group bacterium]|nr:hypothetical protein [Parcubacteria group bacterium]